MKVIDNTGHRFRPKRQRQSLRRRETGCSPPVPGNLATSAWSRSRWRADRRRRPEPSAAVRWSVRTARISVLHKRRRSRVTAVRSGMSSRRSLRRLAVPQCHRILLVRLSRHRKTNSRVIGTRSATDWLLRKTPSTSWYAMREIFHVVDRWISPVNNVNNSY